MPCLLTAQLAGKQFPARFIAAGSRIGYRTFSRDVEERYAYVYMMGGTCSRDVYVTSDVGIKEEEEEEEESVPQKVLQYRNL